MIEPQLYAEYDRRGVHDIFAPGTPFTPGAGTWGIRGIIPLDTSPGDFVLFVTFGKQEGEHLFDETISSEGILRWQSEPKQSLTSGRVVELLRHDERIHTVHLFLRTTRLRNGVAPPFTYLGPLKYRNHDAERVQPVHVAWELLEWPIPPEVQARMDLAIVPEGDLEAEPAATSQLAVDQLEEEDPPVGLSPPGEATHSFAARKRRYLSSEDSRDLGLRGERLVLDREIARLTAAGRADLAEKVVHTSVIEGDGAGYDIRSYFVDGTIKHIEVKTTTGPKTSDFLISPNELAFAAEQPDSYELCRVYNYDSVRNWGNSFSIRGKLADVLHLTETQYRARVVGGPTDPPAG